MLSILLTSVKKIIPYLLALIKLTQKFAVYTSAIRALGITMSEEGYRFLFPLIIKKEKWILDNDIVRQ
ncbi:MAG: hypothetical protein N3A65_00325 [candidate division WOR-3 bacterium]|nr:hypothetical protein [candidate division WOR-3 bacterium]